MTQISSKKSYLAIPVSILFHTVIFLLLLINWVQKRNLENSNQKVTLIEFDKDFLKSETLVDPGVKSEIEGKNRGLQNQVALDLANENLKQGQNFQSVGIKDPNMTLNNSVPEVKPVISKAKDSPKKVEIEKMNIDDVAELHKNSEVRPKSSYTRIFKSKAELSRKNIESSAGKNGSFTLSSYEWEYAPYMYEWIEKIKNGWVEPISYLAGKGQGGRVIVKVSVSKTGKKISIDLIYSNVNSEMTSEALKAVEKAFDLRELPDSFKENKLEATFNMIYPAFD